ncbi:MAG: glycosyltransferase family 4 protein [Acidobacteriia bacterium]|nr:glycosyltransferase family 4 protein [Terriglobia bacterium]
MRILMLAQFYPPTIGGEERHVADLSAELAARGHQVSVATLWHKGFPCFEVDKGVRIHRMRGTMQRMDAIFSYKDRQFAPPFTDPEALWALRRIISQERPDIIHAHNWIVHSFTPLKAWSRAKLVMTLHDYSLVCVQKRLMHYGVRCSGPGFMKCLSCATDFYGIGKGVPSTLANFIWGEIGRRTVDMFLPVSRSVAEQTQLAKRRVPYRIIPNFIPDNAEPPGDNANSLLAQLPKNDFLLFVGDVVPDKGADTLLEAHAQLNNQIPLVLIGQPAAGFVERFPPNVWHMGRWPHDAIMGAWSRCTIALIPSICPDACPTVAMEAMSMGRPIIASRIGGLTDIILDDKTGLLVPPGDPQALREAIQCLLDDPERRECMKMTARQRVVEFQAKSVVPRIEQVYHEVLTSCS